MTDIADMICFMGEHGDRITSEFLDKIEPRLAGLSTDELWMMAGMLLYLGSPAEARVAAEYAADPPIAAEPPRR